MIEYKHFGIIIGTHNACNLVSTGENAVLDNCSATDGADVRIYGINSIDIENYDGLNGDMLFMDSISVNVEGANVKTIGVMSASEVVMKKCNLGQCKIRTGRK